MYELIALGNKQKCVKTYVVFIRPRSSYAVDAYREPGLDHIDQRSPVVCTLENLRATSTFRPLSTICVGCHERRKAGVCLTSAMLRCGAAHQTGTSPQLQDQMKGEFTVRGQNGPSPRLRQWPQSAALLWHNQDGATFQLVPKATSPRHQSRCSAWAFVWQAGRNPVRRTGFVV